MAPNLLLLFLAVAGVGVVAATAADFESHIPVTLHSHLIREEVHGDERWAPAPAAGPLPSGASRRRRPLAPALFVFGDSSVDCGTNNYLGTLARADLPPYGRDFDTHQPTGRFSNGRIPVDYLAIRLGLPFVPPFLGQGGTLEEMVHGVNFASAAAGIIFSSGSDLGQHISLMQQIQQATDTFQQFMLILGEAQALKFISQSIFYVSIGSNDFIHYYLRNVSSVRSLYRPWEFNMLLSNTVKLEIKKLYNTNVRKVVVMGLAPLGCAPHYLWQYNSTDGACVDEINNVVIEFNFAIRYMIADLNQELPGAMFTFCDVFQGSMEILRNHEKYGFKTITEACCGLGQYKGWIMCLSPAMACDDATTHIWWDQYHPTDVVNSILADNVWSGLHSNICHPVTMKDMVKN